MYEGSYPKKQICFNLDIVQRGGLLYTKLDAKSNKAGPVLKTGNWDTSKLTQV